MPKVFPASPIIGVDFARVYRNTLESSIPGPSTVAFGSDGYKYIFAMLVEDLAHDRHYVGIVEGMDHPTPLAFAYEGGNEELYIGDAEQEEEEEEEEEEDVEPDEANRQHQPQRALLNLVEIAAQARARRFGDEPHQVEGLPGVRAIEAEVVVPPNNPVRPDNHNEVAGNIEQNNEPHVDVDNQGVVVGVQANPEEGGGEEEEEDDQQHEPQNNPIHSMLAVSYWQTRSQVANDQDEEQGRERIITHARRQESARYDHASNDDRAATGTQVIPRFKRVVPGTLQAETYAWFRALRV